MVIYESRCFKLHEVLNSLYLFYPDGTCTAAAVMFAFVYCTKKKDQLTIASQMIYYS